MQNGNRVFEDAARVAGGALGTLYDVKRELGGLVRHQIDKMVSDMNLITRDEFDAVRAMAIHAREENEKLEARLKALETSVTKTKTASNNKRKAGARGVTPKKD